MQLLEQEKIRKLLGWGNAPIPICMEGDYRALTFCCKPGYSLTFGYKCQRDKNLHELGISHEKYIKIKERFSKENDWDSDIVCFGSISYCCMRAGGCPKRDAALRLRYPDLAEDVMMEEYFQKKKELSKIILEQVTDPEAKKKVQPYLELFESKTEKKTY